MKITAITKITHHDSLEKYDGLNYNKDTGMYTCIYREIHSQLQYNLTMNPSEALWLTDRDAEIRYGCKQKFFNAFNIALNEYIHANLLNKEG